MNTGNSEYFVFKNSDEMWQFMAAKWREIASVAIKEKGYFTVALSGGKTPVGFYQRLLTIRGLPWDKTHIFLVDERFVPPFHAESNYGMLQETLLSKIRIPPQNIHCISTLALSPHAAAEKYEKELIVFFRLHEGGIPEFDLILLGIGEDGHTASLFPGSEALKERRHLVSSVKLDILLHDRVTLTLPVINNARNVVFLLSGKHKAAVARKLIDEKDHSLPASMVKPEKGRLIFLMEREARELSNP